MPNPEDEAIQMAVHVGDVCVTSIGRLLEVLLRAVESYKQSRYGYDPYGQKQDGVVKSAAKAAGSAISGAATAHMDGVGSVGFVKNKDLGDDITFIDASDIFDNDESGRLTPESAKAWKAFRQACIDNGIGVSITRGIPGSGDIRIGVSGKNAALLADSLRKAGIELIDHKAVDASDVPSVSKQEGIKRVRGEYPASFRFGGLDFERDPEAVATWVASDARDARKKIAVTDMGDGSATWRITRNGNELANGKVTPLGALSDDPRLRYYKRGAQLYDVDEDGRRTPLYQAGPDGVALLDKNGDKVPACERVFCAADDPDVCGVSVRAGLDAFSIARDGQPLESAIIDATAKLDQLSVPTEVRTANERDVADLNSAAESLGKGVGGAGARRVEKKAGLAPSPVKQAERAAESAKRTAQERDARSKARAARVPQTPRPAGQRR